MPQDSLRSIVYRSFVTCDDPKGVVECGTIRKSKTHSKNMEHKSESQRTRKNLNTSSTYKEENKETISMGITDDLRSPSSFQLLEVSKDAQKLNQTIDSWSNGLSFDGQSKDIAKDLLRGALDLQDSLVMLGKLQEASQYMAKLKKKQKEKSERERVDEAKSQRIHSDRFGDQNFQMGFQNPRFSTDGSSKDSFDELRRAIREGLAKQNLLPKNEEKINYDWRRLDSASDIPSTSSSQSSAVYSNNLAKLKKKKEKFDRERAEDEEIDRLDSKRFGDQYCQKGFRKPQFSADGVSGDSIEELKRVIRDGLAKQIRLPNSINEEKHYSDRRRLDSGLEVPSTSSSQSSMLYSNNVGSTASSNSSVAPEKAKVPNLIAKLMGLEEFPSIPSQSAFQKQSESDKMSIQWRPIFDIGMPKARKPHFVTQKVDPERRTLKEVLETMRFKGLLKTNSVKELKKVQSHPISDSLSKQRLIEDMPHIVIMKPFLVPCLESEEPLASKFTQKESSLDTHTNDMPRKLNVKEEVSPTGIDSSKRISHTNETHRKLEAEEKETPIKRLSQAGNAKDSKVVVARPEERKVRSTKEKASYKIKPSVPVNIKLHKEDATDMQSGKVRKVSPSGKKSADDNAKSKILLKSQDANVSLTKPSKPGSNSNIRKIRIPQQQPTSQNNFSKCTKPIKHHSSTDWKKNQTKKGKPVEEPVAANLVMETSECKDDDTKINMSCDNEPVLDIHITTLANQLPAEQETESSKIETEEHCTDGQSSISLSEVMPQTSQHEKVAISDEESDHKGDWETQSKSLKTRTNLKNMLLDSPSFLSHAEELFDLWVDDHPGISQTLAINELEESNVKLSLDCAKELMERRSHRESQSVHPLLQTNTGSFSNRLSLEQLVEEIYDGVENLRSYSKLGGENFLIDGVFSMLDRDLKCKGLGSSIWEWGWKIGFSTSEVEQVVAGLEKLVLGGLIEEVFTDFMV